MGFTADLLKLAKEKRIIFKEDKSGDAPGTAVALLQDEEDAKRLALLIDAHHLDGTQATVVKAADGAFVPAVRVDAKWLPVLKDLGLEVRDAAISPESVRKTGESNRETGR